MGETPVNAMLSTSRSVAAVQNQHLVILKQYNPFKIVNASNMSVLELIDGLLAHSMMFEIIGTKQAISMFNTNYAYWIKANVDSWPEVKELLLTTKPENLEHQQRLDWKVKKREVANIVYNYIARIVDSHRTKAKGAIITVNTLDAIRLKELKAKESIT